MSDALPIRRRVPDGAHGQQHASVRVRLRARQQQLARDSTRLFVLPGYDDTNGALGGQLLVRYRRMTFDEITRQRANGTDDTVAYNTQFLVDACDDIMIREPDGSLTPLVEGHKTTYTVNLDTGESLGTVLGFEHLTSAREQIVAAFGENELAVNIHAGEVHDWMTRANDADAETALGETQAR
jgi:hypothetical protein